MKKYLLSFIFLISSLSISAAIQRTFAMIKPDAVAAGNTYNIIRMIKENGFRIIKAQKVKLYKKGAELFYSEHNGKSFYEKLISYITSGPMVVMVLEKENAITDWRTLMGTTNPANADEGTIRKLYGTDVTQNATHGSDSVESAERELRLIFPDLFK